MTALPFDAPVATVHVADGVQRLNALATLRFLCILVIVTRHYAPYANGVAPVTAHALARIDASEFFFVASGYLRHRGTHARVKSNLIQLRRQLARLYPLHAATTLFFAFAALAGMTATLQGEPLWRCLLVNLLLLQAWGTLSALSLNFPSWFLSAIFGMYLLYPLLRRLVVASPAMAVAAIVLTLVLLEWLWPLHAARHWTSWTWEGGGIRALPSFALGVLIAEWERRRDWRLSSSVPALALLAASLTATMLDLVPLIAKFGLQGLGLLAIVAAERGLSAGVLAKPGLAAWDQASFPLFLLHAPIAAVLLNVVAIRLLHLSGMALVIATVLSGVVAVLAARGYAVAQQRFAS